MQSAGSTNFVMVGSMFVALIFLYFLPLLISTMRLYAKAGKPSWSPIIPVYNTIVMAEIGKKPVWMGVLAALGIIAQYLGALGPILALVAVVFSLIILAAYLKQYDMSLGKQVLYIFVPIVFVFMVKDTKYIGGAQGPTQAQPVQPVMPPAQPAAPVAQPQPVAPQVTQPFSAPAQPTANENINQN